MTIKQTRISNAKVIVLLAPGFEEGAAIYCLDRMREAGIPVSLVGMSAGLISGTHGVTVRPDYTLGQLVIVSAPKIIFIPDGKKSVSALLADPRVHRLLTATLKNNGVIAAMPIAATMLRGEDIVPYPNVSNNIITQSKGSLDEFTEELINLIIS